METSAATTSGSLVSMEAKFSASISSPACMTMCCCKIPVVALPSTAMWRCTLISCAVGSLEELIYFLSFIEVLFNLVLRVKDKNLEAHFA